MHTLANANRDDLSFFILIQKTNANEAFLKCETLAKCLSLRRPSSSFLSVCLLVFASQILVNDDDDDVVVVVAVIIKVNLKILVFR